jgi:hypothetical protein
MKKLFFLWVALLISGLSFGQVTTNSGSGLAATYTSLANAITALNAATITSPVVITLTGNETTPIGGYSITQLGGTIANTITIQGSASTITAFTPQASGSKVDAIFKIVGGDYITIQNFTMQENAGNTVSAVATNTMTEFGVALFAATTTNGAQNNTIQNNTITLSSATAYQNAIGIFLSHVISSSGAAQVAISIAGTNSNNKFYGNIISGVASGFYFHGTSQTATIFESGNDIGGTSSGTGNTITFGKSNTAGDLGFTSYSGTTPAGIYFRNVVGNSARFNTISSYATLTLVCSGIFSANGTAPTGITYTTTISDNNITITNVGTTAITGIDFGSGLSTGTIAGSNNTIVINQNSTAANAAAIIGIKASYASATNTLNTNTITVNQNPTVAGSITSAVTGITAAGVGTTVNVNSNIITFKQAAPGGTATYGSGTITYISVAAASGTVNANFNNLSTTGSVIRSTGTIYGVNHSASFTTAFSCSNNTMNIDASSATGSSSAFYATYSNGSSVISNYNMNNNNITLVSITSGGTAAIYNTDGGTPTKNFNNNTIVITGSATPLYGIYMGYGTMTASGNSVSLSTSTLSPTLYAINNITSGTLVNINNNTFPTISASAASTSAPIISVIRVSYGTNNTIYSNVVNNVSTGAGSGSATVNGIEILSTSTSNNIYQNKIYGLSTGCSGTSTIISGIKLAGATTNNVYNNLIGDLAASAASAIDALRGINIISTTASSTNNIFYNTIYLNATSSGGNFGTTGIYHTTSATATTAALDMRNNIIVNTSTANGTGITVAYRRSSTTLTNYASTSNANAFYAGATQDATHAIYYDGTTPYAFAAYQTLVGPSRDAVSFRELPPFIGGAPYDLHLNTAIATYCESGGLAITTPIAITDDFDGNARSSTPDVGADEFAGIAAGVVNPSLSAAVASSQQINLTFTTNPSVNNVVIVWNATGTFTVPSGVPPTPGSAFAGGTLIYNGTTSPFNHTGLTPAVAYYYKAFSYDGANYSSGVSANATPGVAVPTAFTSTPASSSQINLAYTKNAVGDDVIIATNSTSVFGAPVNGTTYNTSDPITGGGTVIYRGSLSAYNHTSLSANTTYYYKVWSVDAYSYYSATGATANATTLCGSVSSFPFNEGFESGYTDQTTVGGCWTQEIIGSYYWTANSTLATYNRAPKTGTWDAYLHYNGDSWLFRAYTLTGGTSYDVSCWARQDGATTTDASVAISYGTTGTSAGMTNTIVATTGMNASYAQLTGSFTPPTTGVYYIGFHGIINNTPYYLTIDDIKVDLSPSMTYTSSTTTQNTNITLTGAINQQIIGVQVVMNGALSPLSATQLDFTTNGSTNAADISNAKLFYTGTSSTFATTTQVGSTASNPSGSFSVTGSQTLSSGTNYFWLAYDISSGATINNVVDAECNSITIGGTPYTPTVQAPVGTRTIKAPLSGTKTVGTGGDFTTLTGATGIFNEINTYGLGTNLTINIISDITEPGTTALNQWAESGAGNYTLTIQPVDATVRTLSGNYAGGLIRLNGADRVTINGNYGGSGQYLVFSNANTGTSNNTISLSTTAADNTIKNCKVYSKYRAINITAASNTLIEGNDIYGDVAGNSNDSQAGIYISTTSTNTKIRKNSVHDFYYTGTSGYGCYGIYYGSDASTVTEISNNVIYAIKGGGDPAQIYYNAAGIYLSTGGNINIYSNSIYMSGDVLGAGTYSGYSACISIAASITSLDIRNNNLRNSMGRIASGTTSPLVYVFYSGSANTAFTNIDYNNYYFTDQANVTESLGYLGSARADLTAWKTASAQDVNSKSTNPNYTGLTNLLPTAGSYLLGTALGGITTDFAGVTRSNPPDIGAYEGNEAGRWIGGTSTSWNTGSNWDNNLKPTISDNVIISTGVANMPTIDLVPATPATCNALTINTGATLTIAAGKALTASGTTTNNGTFTIESDVSGTGSFIDNGTISGTGTYNVQRYVSTNGATGRWEYVSSPIASASSDLFASASHPLYYAVESSNTWNSYASAANHTLEIMKGFTRKYLNGDGDGNTVKTFTGTGAGILNTGSQSVALTGTTLTTFNGWNLVGNPYPSTIDWDLVSASNSDIEGSYYVRSNGTFGSYVSGMGTITTTKDIPPMQAFWVRVKSTQTTGTLTCNNSFRIHGAHNIYKTTFNNTLHLTVANNANSLADDTYIRFNPDATDSFDGQYDAYKMFAADATYPQVYTNNGIDDIAINSLSDLLGERNVALGFKTTISGQFTLTSDMVSTFTANGNTVYLEDLQTGTYQDLSANSTYVFTSAVTTGLTRFVLHFNPTITSISEDVKNEVQLFGYNNQVHIKSLNLLDGDVTVYDILGQVVTSKHLSGSTSEVINLDPKSAVYIVKYTTNSQTITKRIFINQ